MAKPKPDEPRITAGVALPASYHAVASEIAQKESRSLSSALALLVADGLRYRGHEVRPMTPGRTGCPA